LKPLGQIQKSGWVRNQRTIPFRMNW